MGFEEEIYFMVVIYEVEVGGCDDEDVFKY